MRQTVLVIYCGILFLGPAASAQRRLPGQKPTVGVTIALKAGSETYAFTGQASCTHAPVASIYGIASGQWTVQQSADSRSAQLTLWKPTNGSGEMFSLSVSSAGRSQSVNTVKASGAAAPQGSGKVTFAPAGKGGTFAVDAKTATGTPITGTITCDTLMPAIAEGGD